MSEYWVSHKRYLCKYCNIYIADDAPSRRQHEGGLKHKGNVERFVRGLYKAGEKRKQDREEERREMERVERVSVRFLSVCACVWGWGFATRRSTCYAAAPCLLSFTRLRYDVYVY